MGRYIAQVAAIGVVLGLAACPVAETPAIAPIPPMATGKVRVRVFTEPAPVRLVTTIGKLTFVATDNELSRWDELGVATGDFGVPVGAHVIAMAAEPERKQLWILSDLGLGHYDTNSDSYAELASPPTSLGIDFALLAKEGASLAPAGDGGVWLGTTRGLFYASGHGGWTATPINESVRGLVRDRAGFLWIATRAGMLTRKPTGETVYVTATEGCAIVDARMVVELGGDRMLVIGTDAEGHERLAIGKQLNWVTYRALPAMRWDAAVGRGSSAVVMAGNRVYRISTDARAARPLSRDTLRLVPLVGTPTVDWSIEPLDLALPANPMMLAVVDDQLLVGTRDLGVARYRATDTHPYSWLRRKQMFEDAKTLTVACVRPEDCWIATGAKQAWHWIGDRFVPGGLDRIVLAVVRDPAGPIYALYRVDGDPVIHMARIEGSTWTPLSKIALATPGTDPELSFARFASSGVLWVGLRYRDGLEPRPYGLAIVEPVVGKVTYHRTEQAIGDKKSKMLPIPIGVVDADVRGDTAWFATNEGVARLAGGRVKLWTEADGLRSELVRAVTIAAGGDVIVVTGSGAGVWDGKTWEFPAMLRFEINDVIATRNRQVWMATERGIAAWDGKKVRRVDTRRGLAENQVLDVAVDQFDRVWARGPGSLTLVAQ